MYASALQFDGLYTFPNPLTKVPAGAAFVADNLTANQDGTAQCRRGIARKGDLIGVDFQINKIFSYQNHLMLFGIDNLTSIESLYFDSSPDISLTWSQYAVTYQQAGSTTPRGVEANKNFYMTSSKGIIKWASYLDNPVSAGVPPGLDGTGFASGLTGFLGASKQCAFQIVFGYTDANGNLNLGNPSERILVVNSGIGSADVTLTFTVPQGLTTDYFYQIYRTVQTTYSATPSLNVPPGAEPQLSTQQQLVAGDISTLSITYTDVTPDALLGAALYTNPSQQGALQNNDRPPFALDMCVFQGMMFYANTYSLQSMTFSLISVGPPNGIDVGSSIVINGITFTGAILQNNAAKHFFIDTGGTIAENIDNTTRNLIECINANAATTHVYALYLSGYNSLPGLIELQAVDLSVGTFYVTTTQGIAFSPVLPALGTTFGSSSDVTPNGIYVSKVNQPEAVPVINLIFVGGGDQPIYRILPLRDRVIVLKSDGVFVITGSTPQTLSITPLDTTVFCISADSAVLLNNSVYCMTTQGVVAITESGVTIQSRAIEADLLQLTGPQFFNFAETCEGVSYESERMYILGMATNNGDQWSTQAFCYNWVTNAWTRWTTDFSSGLVNPYDNRLYLSRPTNDPGYLSQERKNYLYTDFIDNQFPVTISGVDATGLIITITGVPDASWVGYGLDQTNAGIAIITAVDIPNNKITVDFQNSTTPDVVLPWANGAANVDVPIPIAFVGVPITAGFPHYLKDWTRVNFWFNGGNFQLITAGFITDVQGPTQYLAAITTGGYGFGPFGATPYGGTSNYPQSIQTLVPGDVAKARWLQPALSLSFPQARFSYLGTTASYEIISDVSG